jgi:hypothetical protein
MKNLNFLKNSILLVTLSSLFINCSSDNSTTNDSNTSSKKILAEVYIVYMYNGDGYSTECDNQVKNDGGAAVTSRGICWGTSSNPTIELNNKTVDGSGLGDYKSTITNLQPNKTYYFRAYATNSVGTSYSTEMIILLGLGAPKLSTKSATDILGSTAITGGNILNDGGAEIIEKGVCWSIKPNPTIADNKTIDGKGTNTFTSTISGLSEGTTYYIRAYATNFKVLPQKTGYGNEIVITTKQFSIGENYLGRGQIFYILKPGDAGYSPTTTHGLIVAPNDIITNLIWGSSANPYIGSIKTGSLIGDGLTNTDNIITTMGQNFNYAAKACKDSRANNSMAWYLPSTGELHELSKNCDKVGININSIYWSSTLSFPPKPILVKMSGGTDQLENIDGFAHSVRAITSF